MVHQTSIQKLMLVLLSGASVCTAVYTPISSAGELEALDRVTASAHAKPGTPATNAAPRFEIVQHDAERSSRLLITGTISQKAVAPVYIDMEVLKTLPLRSITTSTVVTDGVLMFEGVLMRSVLEYVGAQGQTVTARALNGYEVEIPVKDFMDFDVLLAWSMNGTRLKSDDKGPFWIVYPRDQHDVLQDIRYDYRWVWQLTSLQVN